MANYLDVAKYITEKLGEITAMKLQKLMYYSQAWHLVWAEKPLFDEDFQAWANGPVLPLLYSQHAGQFSVNAAFIETKRTNAGAEHQDQCSLLLTTQETNTIDKVLSFYGDKTAQWLSDLTHQEAPWMLARGDTEPMERSTAIIEKSAIHEYYSSL